MELGAPIKELQTIQAIKELYLKKGQIHNLLLFTLAINTGANLNTLLNLDVKDVKSKFYLQLSTTKSIPLNEDARNLISKVIKGRKSSEPLFLSRQNKRLDRTSALYIFKEICKELGLPKNINIASWRKTFAYHHYQKYKDLSFLMWFFEQHSVNLALKFIGVEENMNLRYGLGINL